MRTLFAAFLLFLLFSPVAVSVEFNPDAEPDRILWNRLESEFGPLPAAPEGSWGGVIVKTLINPHWSAITWGMLSVAEKTGIRLIVEGASTENEAVEQLNAANKLLRENCAVYLVSPQTDANLEPFFRKARRDGLPVVNVDDAVYPGAELYVGTNQRQKGALAAELLIKRFPGGGLFAVIEGRQGVFASRERAAGFIDAMLMAGDGFAVAETLAADWDRGLASRQAAVLLLRYPDLKGIFCVNDIMALGAIEAVADNRRVGQTEVVGCDGIDEALVAVCEGSLLGTVHSFPLMTGAAAMEVAVRVLAGQELPRVVETPQTLVTRENVEEFVGLNAEALMRKLRGDAGRNDGE